MDTLELAPRVSYRGEALELQSKHVALICFVALQGRPCTRSELSDVLWGPGRSGNLRTALYKLRGLPGADTWLKDGEFVELVAQSNVTRLEHARGAEHVSDEVLALLDGCIGNNTSELLFSLRAPTATYSEWLEQEPLLDALEAAGQVSHGALVFNHTLALVSNLDAAPVLERVNLTFGASGFSDDFEPFVMTIARFPDAPTCPPWSPWTPEALAPTSSRPASPRRCRPSHSAGRSASP